MADVKPIRACVRYKIGNKWKERVAILKRLSPVADCLHIFLQKMKGGSRSCDVEISLEEMCGIETNSFQKLFLLHIISLNQVHTFDFLNIKIRDLWVIKIYQEMGQGLKFNARVEKISQLAKLSRCDATVHIHRDNVAIIAQPIHKSSVKLHVAWKICDIKKLGPVQDNYYIVISSSQNNSEANIITLSHLSSPGYTNDNVIKYFTRSLTRKTDTSLNKMERLSTNRSLLDQTLHYNDEVSRHNQQSSTTIGIHLKTLRTNSQTYGTQQVEYAILSSNVSKNISSSMESNYSADHPRQVAATLSHPSTRLICPSSFRRLSTDDYITCEYIPTRPTNKIKITSTSNAANIITSSCFNLSTTNDDENGAHFSKDNLSIFDETKTQIGENLSEGKNMIIKNDEVKLISGGNRLSKSMGELTVNSFPSQHELSAITTDARKLQNTKTSSLSSDNYLSMSPNLLRSPKKKKVPTATLR